MRLSIGIVGIVVFVTTAGAQQVDPDKSSRFTDNRGRRPPAPR
jgi:hypothetical protein